MKRRSFIQTAAFGAAYLSLPACSTSMSNPTAKQIGVALVGLGYYATHLLAPALELTKHCKLTGIVTGTPSKIPTWQKKYNIKDQNVFNYQNFSELANNDDIDVVYIVLPNTMHAEYAIKAAEAGKHVWCEKPMATSVKDCQAIIDACVKNKVQLTIGYRVQHEPNTQTIVSWRKTKPYGNIKSIIAEAGFRSNFPVDNWKMKKELGGGAIWDMGTYPINAVRYVSGEFPIAVTASHENTRTDVFTEVNETTIFQLEFASGLIANCKTTFAKDINNLQVSCENGSYGLSPFQSYSGVKGRTSDGQLLNKKIENQQAAQMDNDALAIINNSPVLVPGIDGLEDVRIIEGIMKSAASGQRVVF